MLWFNPQLQNIVWLEFAESRSDFVNKGCYENVIDNGFSASFAVVVDISTLLFLFITFIISYNSITLQYVYEKIHKTRPKTIQFVNIDKNKSYNRQQTAN